jgi:hypothetical protein
MGDWGGSEKTSGKEQKNEIENDKTTPKKKQTRADNGDPQRKQPHNPPH